MIFPFIIEYEKSIKVSDNTASVTNVFTIIQEFLRSKSIDNQYRTENIIKFKQGFFGLNTNVFAGIDKGEFELIENNGNYKLKYRFYFLWYFILSTVFSLTLGLISQQLVFAMVFFFGMAVVNFSICLVRQKGVINDLVYNIDEAYKKE